MTFTRNLLHEFDGYGVIRIVAIRDSRPGARIDKDFSHAAFP